MDSILIKGENNTNKKIKKSNSSTNLRIKQNNNIKELFKPQKDLISNNNQNKKRNLSQPKTKKSKLNINLEQEENKNIPEAKVKIVPKNEPKVVKKAVEAKIDAQIDIIPPQSTEGKKIIEEKITIKNDPPQNISIDRTYESRRHRSIDCDCDCSDFCKSFKKNFLDLIVLGINIAIIVLTARIHSLTKINPLEKYDEENPILQNTDIAITPVNIANKIKNELNQCQCDERIFEFKCTEEQIVSGCYDVSENNHKNLLRFLDDNCDDYNKEIEDNKYQLHKAFDLGFKNVRKMALGILIIYCILFGCTIIVLIATLGVICCGECALVILLPFFPVILLSGIFSGIVNLVLFIIMMVNYYKGYTTGEFLEYYNDCLDSDGKEIFKGIYNKLNKLHSNFTAFVVLNFIAIFLNYVSSCLNRKKRDY